MYKTKLGTLKSILLASYGTFCPFHMKESSLKKKVALYRKTVRKCVDIEQLAIGITITFASDTDAVYIYDSKADKLTAVWMYPTSFGITLPDELEFNKFISYIQFGKFSITGVSRFEAKDHGRYTFLDMKI